MPVNCAAIPKDLIESELFGYEKGAFSGATATGKKGLIEEAANGTLFLDEVGDLSLEAQAKLLRFLENVRRVVFVDNVAGYGDGGGIVILQGSELWRNGTSAYGHSEGLTYLFKVLPFVLKEQLPNIFLVGVKRDSDTRIIPIVAKMCLTLVMKGEFVQNNYEEQLQGTENGGERK